MHFYDSLNAIIYNYLVTAKIRNLQEFYVRLTSGIQPIPTGFDIANTLKHFSSVLLGTKKTYMSVLFICIQLLLYIP